MRRSHRSVPLLLACLLWGAASSGNDSVMPPDVTASNDARDERPAASVAIHGCPKAATPQLVQHAPTSGPLRLAAVHCVNFSSSSTGTGAPILSPDGRFIAHWHRGTAAPIEIASLEASERVQIPNRVSSVFRHFGSRLPSRPEAFAWADGSQSLWSVRQETAAGGWALSGLEPVMFGVDGGTVTLPALRHVSGPLDGLLWIEDDGLALAQFGTRGEYYRPEHADPQPTFAIVDARHGRVIDTLGGAGIGAEDASAAVLPDGRVRVIIQLKRWTTRVEGEARVYHRGDWIIWTQGERAIEWPHPHPTDVINPIALSPDGLLLLVARPLRPGGVSIACAAGSCPPSEPPIPVEGPVAELYDVETREILWTLSGRATERRGGNAQAVISHDGRYALVSMPAKEERRLIALVSMEDGAVIQTFSATSVHQYPQTFGFDSGSHDVWVEMGSRIWRYRMMTIH